MTEIERKFRLNELPAGRSEPVRIEQAYIALDHDVEVRVRRRNGTYTLTVKGGSGLERTEVDLTIDGDVGESLWPLGAGRTIDKRRSTVDLGEHTVEIDEYQSRLRGLKVVEVEFDDHEAADAFIPPSWFGTEITDDIAWSNARLATDGPPRA